MLTIGIDVSKDTLDIAWLQDGTISHTTQIANDLTAITTFVEELLLQDPTWLVCEATGTYHGWVQTACWERGLTLAVLNPYQVKQYREVRLGRTKTDATDAQLLARFGATFAHELRPSLPPPARQTDLLALVNYRTELVDRITVLKNQRHADGYRSTTMVSVAEWRTADLAQLKVRLAEVEQELEELLATFPEAAVLQQIPGVGIQTTAAVLAYVPVALWGRPKQAAAYAGVCPTIEASGKQERSRMSRRGHRRLRRSLYMGALTTSRFHPTMRSFYQRLQEERRLRPRQALVAVMHKLLRQMMGMLGAYQRGEAPFVP